MFSDSSVTGNMSVDRGQNHTPCNMLTNVWVKTVEWPFNWDGHPNRCPLNVWALSKSAVTTCGNRVTPYLCASTAKVRSLWMTLLIMLTSCGLNSCRGSVWPGTSITDVCGSTGMVWQLSSSWTVRPWNSSMSEPRYCRHRGQSHNKTRGMQLSDNTGQVELTGRKTYTEA